MVPATALPTVFEDMKPIRFHHCDPAGIIFYPQYFVLFHELTEDWFTRGLGISYPELISRDRIGIPMGRVECDFLAPSKIGDQLLFRLRVARLGRSSITLAVDCRQHEEVRARASLTVILAALDTLRSVPISDDLRQRMARYLVAEGGET